MSATIAFCYEITAAGIGQIGDETFDASDGGRNMIQWLAPYPSTFCYIKTYWMISKGIHGFFHFN
jgi:hypothetical protein